MAAILVVEDSSFQRKAIISLLESKGYEVYGAKNGLEALDQLDNINPDLIMTDLLMPEVDGLELMKRTQSKNIPFLVFTADIQKSVKDECISLGAKAFVNKPLDKDKLGEVIDHILINR